MFFDSTAVLPCKHLIQWFSSVLVWSVGGVLFLIHTNHLHVVVNFNHNSFGSGDSSTRDQPEPSTTLHIGERELACFACLCYLPFHWLRLLTLALSIGPCQCSYIFVSCWPSAFNLQVTWIKKYRSQQRLSRIRSLALYSGSSIGARAALSN